MVESILIIIVALVFLFIGYIFGIYRIKTGDNHYNDMKDLAHTYGNLSAQLINSIGKAPLVYPDENTGKYNEPEDDVPDPGEYADITGGVIGP